MAPLTPEHEAYLAKSAVTLETAAAFDVRSITSADQLPEELKFCAKYLPGILFPWRTPSGKVIPQFRPDNPPIDPKTGKPNKYLAPVGSGSNIGVIRESTTGPNHFIEGMKQALAAYPYIKNGSVYVITGCRNSSTDGVPESDLEVADGCDNILILDGDIRIDELGLKAVLSRLLGEHATASTTLLAHDCSQASYVGHLALGSNSIGI